MAKYNHEKMISEFMKTNFEDVLSSEGFVPSKKNYLLWVKLSGKDILSFIWASSSGAPGDFNIAYGCRCLFDWLPLGASRKETDIFAMNNFIDPHFDVRYDPRGLPQETQQLISCGFRLPLTCDPLYAKKLKSIALQLENYALPDLKGEITFKEAATTHKRLFKRSIADYRCLSKEDFKKQHSKISPPKDDADKKDFILSQDQWDWERITDYYVSHAVHNDNWAEFDEYLGKCKEYNLKLLKRTVPLLFERYF